MIKNAEELEALVSLLDDPDYLVHGPVIERLIEMGAPAVKMLEYTWETSSSNLIQVRIENVILQIQKELTKKDLKDWADCRGDQLLYGAYLIARSQYPDIDYAVLERKIEILRSEIWLELNNRLTALEKVRIINHFMFSVHKFNRSIRGLQSPQLYFINHVLDTRKGIPVTLAIIYAEIAARLDLPIYCVDLPHNFLLCYHDPTYLDDPDGVLFYINPYTQGTVLGRAEVELFLKEQKLDNKPEYMRPCSNLKTIGRLSEGLQIAYGAAGQRDKSDYMKELLKIMDKGVTD